MPIDYSEEERMILRNVGSMLRAHRKRCRLTQEQVAELTDTSVPFLSDMERGKNNFGILKLARFAKAFEIPLKNIFDDYT